MVFDFDRNEKFNLVVYATGIFIWKFALETMNTCMSGIVLNRLDYNPTTKKGGSVAGVVWTSMQSINVVAQVIGVLLVGPLFKRFRPGNVLAFAALCWGLVVMCVPIIEAATGGGVPSVLDKGSLNPIYWGNWSPYLLYLFFTLAGLFSGIVELIRRVIPAHIMGSDPVKLKHMDAIVHMANEASGTAGAILARYWISYFGWGYALAILPLGFTIASVFWFQIRPTEERIEYEQKRLQNGKRSTSVVKEFFSIVYSAAYSLIYGMRLVFSERNLIWLIPSYSLALVGHRYLEGTIFPFYAKEILKNSDLQTILTGGSNFGEFLGGLAILILARVIPTPIPWIRSDALTLLLIWVLPYWRPGSDTTAHAWALFPIMMIISFGWSAGDTSLAAHVQSILSKYDYINEHTSPLHSVMSFLYLFNVLFYFIVNILIGRVRDSYVASGGDLYQLFVYIGAIPMTVAGVIIFLSTFIPFGSFAINPKAPHNDFAASVQIFDEQREKGAEGTIVVVNNST